MMNHKKGVSVSIHRGLGDDILVYFKKELTCMYSFMTCIVSFYVLHQPQGETDYAKVINQHMRPIC